MQNQSIDNNNELDNYDNDGRDQGIPTMTHDYAEG